MVYQPVRIVIELLFVHPVISRLWRVERTELPVFIAAAKQRLVQIPDLFHTGELVEFFKPNHTDIAKWRFDGLELHGIIIAHEINLLSRMLQGDFRRGNLCGKQTIKAHSIDSP